jgi:hypothetical protein
MSLPASHPAGQILLALVSGAGWAVTTTGEAEVARQLGLLGYTPRDVETQFRLGRYRLDFAIPAARIDIEADGWVHGARDVRLRDARRDREVKAWGWTVVRIDTERDDTAAQLRRRVPDRSRIGGYGDTLRHVDVIFEAFLDRLQGRGVTDPAAQLERLRVALLAAYRAAGGAGTADAS